MVYKPAYNSNRTLPIVGKIMFGSLYCVARGYQYVLEVSCSIPGGGGEDPAFFMLPHWFVQICIY